MPGTGYRYQSCPLRDSNSVPPGRESCAETAEPRDVVRAEVSGGRPKGGLGVERWGEGERSGRWAISKGSGGNMFGMQAGG